MRRIVDTLILLLVAYTVSWPLLRGFVGADETEGPLRIEVRGLADQEATVHIAMDEDGANQQLWAAVAECREGSEAAVVSGFAGRDRVWIVVHIDGTCLPPYALTIDRSSEPARLVVDLPFRDDAAPTIEVR